MPEDPAPPTRGGRSQQISNAITALTRDATGRGPVRARTIIDGDAVVVLMHDSLTKAEQTLVDNGHAAEVLALRRAFQAVMRPAYSTAVEEITGRPVVSFMSTNHAEPDHSAEIFLLDGSPQAREHQEHA